MRSALLALEYPHARTFDPTDARQVFVLVSWLEDTKVRSRPVEDRGALREHGEEWPKTFQAYLAELGCARTAITRVGAGNFGAAILWLVNYAVYLEYRDRLDEGVPLNSSPAVTFEWLSRHASAESGANAPDEIASGDGKHLNELCELLGIPASSDSNEVLRAVTSLLKDKALVSAAVASGQALPSAADCTEEQYPLGFSTGDASVDKIARVLRLLYTAHLRDVQVAVNEMIVQAQEFTANPKTNAMLGKVGR